MLVLVFEQNQRDTLVDVAEDDTALVIVVDDTEWIDSLD